MSYLDDATLALTEYGYTLVTEGEDIGGLVRFKGTPVAGLMPRDMWLPVDDGFLRFTRSDGSWQSVPYTINERFAKASGLNHLTTPECYDYVYPAEEVWHIYSVGVEEQVKYLAEHAAKRSGE